MQRLSSLIRILPWTAAVILIGLILYACSDPTSYSFFIKSLNWLQTIFLELSSYHLQIGRNGPYIITYSIPLALLHPKILPESKIIPKATVAFWLYFASLAVQLIFLHHYKLPLLSVFIITVIATVYSLYKQIYLYDDSRAWIWAIPLDLLALLSTASLWQSKQAPYFISIMAFTLLCYVLWSLDHNSPWVRLGMNRFEENKPQGERSVPKANLMHAFVQVTIAVFLGFLTLKIASYEEFSIYCTWGIFLINIFYFHFIWIEEYDNIFLKAIALGFISSGVFSLILIFLLLFYPQFAHGNDLVQIALRGGPLFFLLLRPIMELEDEFIKKGVQILRGLTGKNTLTRRIFKVANLLNQASEEKNWVPKAQSILICFFFYLVWTASKTLQFMDFVSADTIWNTAGDEIAIILAEMSSSWHDITTDEAGFKNMILGNQGIIGLGFLWYTVNLIEMQHSFEYRVKYKTFNVCIFFIFIGYVLLSALPALLLIITIPAVSTTFIGGATTILLGAVLFTNLFPKILYLFAAPMHLLTSAILERHPSLEQREAEEE